MCVLLMLKKNLENRYIICCFLPEKLSITTCSFPIGSNTIPLNWLQQLGNKSLLLPLQPCSLRPPGLCSPPRSAAPPLPAPLPFVPVWIFRIAAAAGAWCVGLSAHCVPLVWALWYAAPRRVVCRDRRAAADARPAACLSACSVTPDRRRHGRAHTYWHTLVPASHRWTQHCSCSCLCFGAFIFFSLFMQKTASRTRSEKVLVKSFICKLHINHK